MNYLFSFKGRVNKQNYLIWVIVSYLAVIGAVLLISYSIFQLIHTQEFSYFILDLLSFLLLLLALIINLSFTIRRLHDVGKSGWWSLLGFISPLNLVLLVYLLLAEGDRKANSYGKVPA